MVDEGTGVARRHDLSEVFLGKLQGRLVQPKRVGVNKEFGPSKDDHMKSFKSTEQMQIACHCRKGNHELHHSPF